MHVIMAGIDYKSAGVDQRGCFSLTALAQENCLRYVSGRPGIQGCVLLSTCNRTELYLSCDSGTGADPVSLLCDVVGAERGDYVRCFTVREDRRALSHLMMVAAGLRSQIRGEDQILSQVKQAAHTARELHVADPVLETMFRCAISAAKQAKTQAPIAPVEASVARSAVEALACRMHSLEGKRALVVGNGEMGRLAARLLWERGCGVTMTLRSYKRGAALIPQGCGVVPYDERYGVVPECDIVLSATASPHFTIQAERLLQCGSLPGYLVDLAVPRDIDPACGNLAGVVCLDVDSLGGNGCTPESADKLRQILAIMEQYRGRFEHWAAYRSTLIMAGGGRR